MPTAIEQISRDAADKAGEDDRQTRRRIDTREQCPGLAVLHLQHRGGDRDGDLDREERTDEIRTPASSTAVLGFKAPVAIDVAIALPVSWNPFVKSNASAVTISSTRMISSRSRR